MHCAVVVFIQSGKKVPPDQGGMRCLLFNGRVVVQTCFYRFKFSREALIKKYFDKMCIEVK